jgi:transposase InsO family protein
MSNRIGSSTIYTTTLPKNAALNRVHSVKLSRSARLRLRIIEHYRVHGNVSRTCRHFAISRSYFYKWYRRFNPGQLSTLESRSRRPKHVRQACYDHDLVALVRKLRSDYPRLSSKKLAVVLLRDYGLRFSAATIGRVILRFQLYFSKTVQRRIRRKAAQKFWIARKPSDLKAAGPRNLIEFDMKHIFLPVGGRLYAFVAVDVLTKQAVIHVGSQPSSRQARLALEKVVAAFGAGITVLNDNGSENFLHAYEYLKEQHIPQYFARPHTPKDKPHVENLIGKLQQECLDEDRSARTIPALQAQINRWLNDYHYFRPHQALGYATPAEFCDTFGLTIPRAEVSTM